MGSLTLKDWLYIFLWGLGAAAFIFLWLWALMNNLWIKPEEDRPPDRKHPKERDEQ